jgi:DNA-binding MarR family transcriptional regulator
MDDQTEKIEHILKLNKQLLDEFPEAGPVARLEKAWLTNTLTMPQFKTLILIGHASSGQGTTVGMLAKRLQVSFPTMSGIVDRLYEQELVARREDEEDRRITRITTTEKGQGLLDTLYQQDSFFWRKLLTFLTSPELQVVEQAFAIMLRAAMIHMHKDESGG